MRKVADTRNVTLISLFDSCHSGSIMNLPYNAVTDRGYIQDWKREYPNEKGFERVS